MPGTNNVKLHTQVRKHSFPFSLTYACTHIIKLVGDLYANETTGNKSHPSPAQQTQPNTQIHTPTTSLFDPHTRRETEKHKLHSNPITYFGAMPPNHSRPSVYFHPRHLIR
jgi:hypothetical protein